METECVGWWLAATRPVSVATVVGVYQGLLVSIATVLGGIPFGLRGDHGTFFLSLFFLLLLHIRQGFKLPNTAKKKKILHFPSQQKARPSATHPCFESPPECLSRRSPSFPSWSLYSGDGFGAGGYGCGGGGTRALVLSDGHYSRDASPVGFPLQASEGGAGVRWVRSSPFPWALLLEPGPSFLPSAGKSTWPLAAANCSSPHLPLGLEGEEDIPSTSSSPHFFHPGIPPPTHPETTLDGRF